MATPNLMAASSMVEAVLAVFQVPSANTDVAAYTVPTGQGVKVATASVCNTHVSSVTFSLYLVPTGGAVGASKKVIDTVTLTAQDTLSLSDYLGGMMLGDGDAIWARCSVAAVLNVILTGAVAA
jgi:hypothetical protein